MTNSNNKNNKRIAKNTALLYFRMLFTMGVGLYTSRIVLNTLGVEDFGIYNIVGGIVVLFSFLSNALTAAIQRFLTFELGRKDFAQFQKIFNLSLIVYGGLSLLIVLLAETIGLWFLNTYLNLPTDKIYASNWVYQFTIATFVFSLLRTPYNATIIAHEKMNFYAYISIAEVSLKLLVVFALVYGSYDKLILYALLLSVVSFIINGIYYAYCTNKFSECRLQFYWDTAKLKELLSFSSWSLFGSLSVVGSNQGVNIILNIFFGVVVNAAMGIANQVCNAVNQFVSNFQIAFNPQIVKLHAQGEQKQLITLIFSSAKISFFLLVFLSLPILIETDTILTLWLKVVPEHTSSFCRLIILALLIDTFSGPLWMAVQASGKIKKYQLVISSIFWLNVIFTYVLFELGFAPTTAFGIRVIINVVLLATRIYLLKQMIQFPAQDFLQSVILKAAIVTLLAAIFPMVTHLYTEGVNGLCLTTVVSCIALGGSIFCIGLNSSERGFIINIIINRFKKKNDS